MPRYLALDLVDDRIDWSFEPGTPQPFAIGSADTPPREEDLERTFSLVVRSAHRAIPDISILSGNSAMVASGAFRELVEQMDPVLHTFMPVEIRLRDGASQRGSHFLFKPAGLTDDAIDPELSDVLPVSISGRFRYYGATSMTPNLTWKASKIAGRHIWIDRYLPKFLMVSDPFFAEMKRRNMRDFIPKESRINEAL